MERNRYIEKLTRKMHNGMVKVITGIRRSGKTYLLHNLFFRYLIKQNIDEDHIIRLSLDDFANRNFRIPDNLYNFIKSKIVDKKMYYVLLDEVQMVRHFEDVLNSFLHIENVDLYVTGSNAKFLSKDIITEFRGRGDSIHLFPLSFSEYIQGQTKNIEELWRDYSLYGGLPKILDFEHPTDKINYLESIFSETYLKDILERNKIRNPYEMDELLNVIASSIGSLTNPKKLSDTFKSVKKVSIHSNTIKNYLDFLEDSFLISKTLQFDVKGKRYIGTPLKYYFTDVGLRNARLHFRQYEETHIMENIIYNELCACDYKVDVGVVKQIEYAKDKKQIQKKFEVDFICNQGLNKIYVQSALAILDNEKEIQEQNSLVKINDSFKKVIIAKNIPTHYNDSGILLLNLFDFLRNPETLKNI